MKPTPEMIEAACAAVILGEDEHGNPVHLQPSEAEAALSAALSVPAAAVVGEPVGYVSVPELVNLKMGVSCVDLFREPQPGGIDFAPVYAAPSATERDAVVEPVAYASSKEWRKNHLMSAAQYKSALPKNAVDFDIPLYATLPNEALERSEQATFDIAARLLKERDALADLISQQDAELERWKARAEYAEAKLAEALAEVAEFKARYEAWRPVNETPNETYILSGVLFDFYCEEPDADGEDSAFSLVTTWDERPEQAVMWCRIVTPRWPTTEDFTSDRSLAGGRS